MKFFLKVFLALLALLSLVVFLAFQAAQTQSAHNNLIFFLTQHFKEKTPFKNAKISSQQILVEKWYNPLSFTLRKVEVMDQEKKIIFIEKLTICWSIMGLLKGQLDPISFSIHNGQWVENSEPILDKTNLTIYLNFPNYKFDLTQLNFNPPALAASRTCPLPLKSIIKTFHLPIHAAGQLELTDQKISKLNLILTSKAGKISLDPYFPLPVPLQELQINTIFDTVEHLKIMINVVSNKSQLQTKAHFILPTALEQLWQGGDDVKMVLSGNVTSVSLDDLGKLWPLGLKNDPRTWVTKNLTKGIVDGNIQATAILHYHPKYGFDWDLQELSGELFPEDVTVTYFGKLPPVTKTRAHCRYNQHQFIIEKLEGVVNGLHLTGGQIIINDLDKKDQSIQIIIDLIGGVKQVVQIISADPLYLLQKLELPLKNLQGFSTTRLLLKFPLENNIALNQVQLEAKSRLTQTTAQIDGIMNQSLDMTQGNFDLFVDNNHLAISGFSHLNQIPTQIKWTEFFPGKPRPWKRQLELNATKVFIHDKENELQLIEGPLPFNLVYHQDASDQISFTLQAIFDDVMLSLPWFSYYKKKGEAATCHIKANSSKGEWMIEQGTLKGTNLKANLSGNWGLPTSQLKISNLQVGETHGHLMLAHKNNRLKLQGYIKEFDALTLLNRLPRNQSFTRSLIESIDLDLTIGALIFSDSYHLNEAALKVQLTDDNLQTIHLKDKAGNFHFSLTPVEQGVQTFNLESNNAAEILGILSPGNDLRGGKINFIGQRKSQGSHSSINGEIDVKGLTIVEAPLLAKILSLSSIQGILHAISGKGLNFEHGHATINWKEGDLIIHNASLLGSSLGLTFSGIAEPETIEFTGEIIPFYSLNNLLSKIPLIGQILSGPSAEAIFSTPFSLSGKKSDPAIQVHAFKTLTPCGIRKMTTSSLIQAEPPF